MILEDVLVYTCLARLVIKPVERDQNKNPTNAKRAHLCLLYLSEALGMVQNFKYNIGLKKHIFKFESK